MKKKEYIITCQRKIFNIDGDRSTIGEVFLEGDFFCYSLEDEVRFDGHKVYAKTAIPAVELDVDITYSPKFKRDMILLYNRSDYSVVHEGVRFTGIRVHNGVNAKHTAGCPLVGYETDGVTIWNGAEEDLKRIVRQKMREGYTVKWRIEMKPFHDVLDNVMV